MNPIEELCGYLRRAYPEATVEITRPLHADGVWSLDVDLRDSHLSLEWRSKTGFAVSSVSDENFAEGPDEVFHSFEAVKARVDRLLTNSERTSPPFGVLLSRLRQRCGVTQRELASRLGVRQATISGMERRDDVQLTTVLRVIEALGGALEVAAIFSGSRYVISESFRRNEAPPTNESSEDVSAEDPLNECGCLSEVGGN